MVDFLSERGLMNRMLRRRSHALNFFCSARSSRIRPLLCLFGCPAVTLSLRWVSDFVDEILRQDCHSEPSPYNDWAMRSSVGLVQIVGAIAADRLAKIMVHVAQVSDFTTYWARADDVCATWLIICPPLARRPHLLPCNRRK